MRLISILAVFLLMLTTVSALADTDGSIAPTGRGGRHGRANAAPAKSNGQTVIRGICSVVEGPGNPIASPCVNLLLSLTPTDGGQAFNSRSSSSGEFEFATEAGKTYHLNSGSRFYGVVSPTDVVHTGDRVQVKLRLK